ncbi:hypothetical protein [Zhongshania marina]|nr:hypothetical protein [Marortus luteolus]
MSTENRADPANVMLLRGVYHRLLEAQSRAITTIMDDARGDDPYPCFAPLPSGQHSWEARFALANSIKDVFDAIPSDGQKLPSGLLCASPESIEAITELNNAKTALQAAVATIKSSGSDDKEKVNQRVQELKRTMKEVGFAAADLKRVYAKIRILGSDIYRVGWTWGVNHRTYKPIDTEVLERRLQGLERDDPAAAELARTRLISFDEPRPATLFALPDQLRVNYGYIVDGKRKNKGLPVSGVVVVQQKALPKIKWRDRDSHKTQENPREPKGGFRKELLPGWGVYYDASRPL